jgi:uncharacterized protein GlcG (DUF336 family)
MPNEMKPDRRQRNARHRRLSVEILESRQMLAADTLTATEVRGLLTRASAASSSNDGIIAVVDRRGAILGVRVEQGVFDQYLARYGNHGAPTHAYWEKLAFAIDGAVAKARTAASFASGDAVNALSAGGAPLTSRTIRSLSQSTILEREVDSDPNFRSPAFPNPFDSPILGPGVVAPIGLGGHFPPDVRFTPPVDLFNIEFQGRDSLLHPGRNGYKGAATNLFASNNPADLTPSIGADDITLPGRFNVDVTGELLAQLSPPESWGKVSGFVVNAQARGFATLPGGIPLYKNSVAANGPLGDTLVGGIGVFFPGALGYATFEQGFVPASMRPSGKPQTTLERLNAPRVLEAEWVAYAAAGGSLGAARMYNQPALSVGTLGGVPRGVFDLPFGRIDLVGITLEVFGPNPTQQNPNPGVITLLNKGRQVRQAPHGSSGADVPVTTTAARYLNGKQAPFGWLVAPRDSPLPGGPTAADVSRIVNQGVAQAKLTRAAIRLDLRTLTAGPRTKMVLSVADKAGNVLGIYRMQDATVFSIDVAVAKARNTAYYADPTALQPQDKVDDDLLQPGLLSAVRHLIHPNGLGTPDIYADIDSNVPFDDSRGLAFTNRTFRFLAEPRYPAGQDGTVPPVFSILTDPGSNITTGELLRPDGIHAVQIPAKAFTSVAGFNAFHVGRNFHDVSNIANQNGVVFFPGSTPLYSSSILVGGFGVSGDGVDQDDVVTAFGMAGYEPPTSIRADRVFYRGVRLPFQKFNRNPSG